MAGRLPGGNHYLGGGFGGGGQRVIGDYIVTQQIGSGSFAVVWKAHHKQHSAFQVAIKEIATEKLNKKLQESLRSEIAILRRTDHPNIIRLHDIVEGQNRIYLVLEYCAGGDLAAYIQRYGKVDEVVARHFMRQLGAGLQVLRNNNLIHRDLKPQNLLLSTNDDLAVLKIADFGFARSLMPQGMAETLCGSPLYMAPEILQSKRYDAKADLWSVGAILYQLFTGRPPFSGNNHVQLLQNILKSTEIRFPDAIMAQLHPDCIDMCRKLLRKDPVERLAFEEFFAHPFMGAMRSKADDMQTGGSTSGGTGDASETSQEDCFPFTLDDDQQDSAHGKFASLKPPLFSESPPSSPYLPPTGRKPNSGHLSPAGMGFTAPDHPDNRSRILDGVAEGSAGLDGDFHPAHSGSPTKGGRTVASPVIARAYQKSPCGKLKGALGDSIDTIEREYVLVSVPITSTENLSNSSNANDAGGVQQRRRIDSFPQKVNSPYVGTSSGGVGSGASNCSVPSHSSQEAEGPSQHPPTRLSSLQRCARFITELATDKMNKELGLEAFVIQLVCLAIWKEALHVCQTWADSEHVGSNGGRGGSEDIESQERSVANTCSLMEREFAFAVERAESLAIHIDIADEMPDAMELIFQSALELGKAGAVDELMGSMANASSAYEKAASLLYFLVVEAVSLPIQPPLLLSDIDRHRLRRYYDNITARQHQCAASAQTRHVIMAKT
ncbi:serine/threonine-protein kinase ATG1c isoform X2 [Physcomitrium patens]|uniref:Protein kinase domain-containing protein n=1 Tax=Physcomitrium patens TaxID=3218 RepID=A0A7I4C6D6_PHYPA|nr:serine/threonine-protein kinase ATG1b-like isoform X2 [Physcomitrium patens]|eukprot:XP_024359687.1 serine/threonine-protein kinase ATG1b-like isoform X2 [Physcomitrella patens]